MIESGIVIEPGQELAENSPYGSSPYKIVVVDRITPSGLIVLKDGRTFHQNGRERSSASYKSWLYILTPEIRTTIEHSKNMDYVRSCRWDKLDDETLKEVVALLKSKKSS